MYINFCSLKSLKFLKTKLHDRIFSTYTKIKQNSKNQQKKKKEEEETKEGKGQS